MEYFHSNPILQTFIMKQTALVFLLLLTSINSLCANRADTLRSLILDGGRSNHVMVFAHRGDWRNAPAENSLAAYQRCIELGIDGIEVDVQMTKDSVLVVMHDDTLDRVTTGEGRISDFTYDELKSLHLLSPIKVETRQHIPTFREVLRLAKGKILIQVDKWTNVKDLVIKEAREEECLPQIILRSSWNSTTFKERVGSLPKEVIYIPVLVCNGKNDKQKLDDMMSNFTAPIMSFSFKNSDYPILDEMPTIKEQNRRIWLNSLWAKFNGGHDDELAMTNDDEAYGWLIRKGADIIFSDNPSRLLAYLKRINKRIF